MRDIKFRAWIKDLGIIVQNVTPYPSGLIGVDGKTLEDALPEKMTICEDGIYMDDPENDLFELITSILEGDDWYWFEEGQFVLMQYTGLEDKNGKEIYEGDILQIEDETPKKGVVKWGQDHYDFGWKTNFPLGANTGWTPNLVREQNRIEITGNIHEQ